jgi:hypothetical protein
MGEQRRQTQQQKQQQQQQQRAGVAKIKIINAKTSFHA